MVKFLSFFGPCCRALSLALAISAHAAVKSPLDVPAPEDSHVPATRLVGIAATDAKGGRYAAVGPWGKILTSADAGRTWRQQRVPLSSDLVAVHFPTPLSGWAVGHDGVVLHSGDGGRSWRPQLDGRRYGDLMVHFYEAQARAGDPVMAPALEDARRFRDEGADKPFLDVWFENEKSGWVVGAFNLIFRTDDGGATWQPWTDRVDNENAHTMYAIGAVGEEVYIVGELGLVLRLDRERQRFVRVATPYAGSFFGVTGKRGQVFIYGLRGNALRSRDGGKSWQVLQTGLRGAVTSGAVLDDGTLVLADNGGALVVSGDDGEHFTRVAVTKPMSINGMAVAGSGQLILVGERGAVLQTLP